ncbi:MAG: phage holin family protein [Leptolyngbya sp. DLM2.Bin27]|nr:MAG: phage holin family protein [Leptolyngbya sp. DLM2.Bin27]
MWSILLSGIATALSLLVVDLVVPGVTISTLTAAAIAAISVGVVNAFVRPILQTVTMPINVISFGAFSLIVNGLCLWLASLVVPGFYVSGLIGFLVGPLVLSTVNTFIGNYFDKKAPAFLRDGSETGSELSTDQSSQL